VLACAHVSVGEALVAIAPGAEDVLLRTRIAG
jgi:hypothetical protein